jgi:hypothetical protein
VLDGAAAIGPGAEFFGDPCRQTGRRIGQRKGERLRLGALDPLVAGLLAQPLLEVDEVSLFLLGWIGKNRRDRGSPPSSG